MPFSNSSSLGPRWLCCACCVAWQLPIPVLFLGVWTGGLPALSLVATPLFLVSSRRSLDLLITGRAPRSGLELSLRLLGAAAKARERSYAHVVRLRR
jgi:hypothetical protein